ncbi:aspartate/tyrosine/aromatic aminotransferase [Breznakia sp. PF5-3]|uniref:pyridoxal phosphate-dependent aminotransferase n=1 Tax=unclassified Breznakia TaxID=2623764 RepID=UPI002404B6FB|nr:MULTISPECIES: aminotransferase class I/II-fold pyridoxal phosphate-dependent enzyme [unclassified Breznakia]MDF9825259.1 aspartate/tyrosine/aromatic aminotransferase [Breznakia sp. PM6-1]MDF9836151.1 aspartate/tyrosine/aromatic aminotransferase [Breznakia sp. PF5-3]MDF9838162.1 aspartate/tyrosine/aromatic aminotransferase [Breznakia sp. PFB2-8]MDF9860148.1 aspartate/tyrosine/aromatic aminotransferase [Breznakia sp. PH5-24]
MTRFIKQKIDDTPIADNVFAVVSLAKKAKAELGNDKVIDATIGALYDEEGELVAFQSVYQPYNRIKNNEKATYAQSFSGNADYRKQVYNWIKQDINLDLCHSVIATPGGSGAVSTTMSDILDEGQSVVLPEIAWGSYKLMATMNNLKAKTYSLFKDGRFHIESFREVCLSVMEEQGKLLVVVNDPCHNPTGYSLSKSEWEAVIEILNTCGEQGPVILLNDIAYIDFSYDFKQSRAYLETFNQISDNVMIVVAFSSSKTLTAYGLRCGAAVILAKSAANVRQVEIVMEKSARAIWSNIPNAAMENFVYVTSEGLEPYMGEKDYFVSLLEQRSKIFTEEAAIVGLKHYPYKEGFFVTLEVCDANFKDKFHKACMEEQIYTVQVNKGIRVALCSLNIEKTRGLAKKMKIIMDRIS